MTEISLEKAREIDSKYELGDIVNVEIKSKEFAASPPRTRRT